MNDRVTTTALPPPMALYQLAIGHYFSRALFVGAKLGIADLLAAGARDADALAAATHTHAPSLRRVLRLLASAGVLAEEADGTFALTHVGEWLRSDAPQSFRSAALLFSGPMEWAAWGDILHTVETGETALDHVLGMNTFEYLAGHPEESKVFDEAMAAFTALTSIAVAAAYDFSPFATVIDVGGGNGALLAGILRANPKLRGVVFDQPHVVENAARQIDAAGLADRCGTEGGDFFRSVPEGGDAYLLKHIIHDWNDERALAILANCRRAMRSSARLLIVEGIYPERVDTSAASRGAAANDVNMLVCTGGRQRSEREFRALFDAAGFALTGVVPTPSASCIIEGKPL
jgi:orsellinic acid C2-O-methyltransferase